MTPISVPTQNDCLGYISTFRAKTTGVTLNLNDSCVLLLERELTGGKLRFIFLFLPLW